MEEKIRIAEELVKKGFTDGVDISPEISLYEYGVLRRPSDGLTIFGFPSNEDHIYNFDKFDYMHVSLEEVEEELKEKGKEYFSFIGVEEKEKKDYIQNLKNNCLSSEISSLNAYCDSFTESCYFNKTITDIKNLFLTE